MNGEAVSRTAPATPGLLISFSHKPDALKEVPTKLSCILDSRGKVFQTFTSKVKKSKE